MAQYNPQLNQMRKPDRSLSTDGMRLWGAFFAASGIFGQAILQNGILNVSGLSGTELLAVLDSRPEMMTVASVALILQFASYCAVPIFAALMAEGLFKTHDFKAYAIRVATLAVVCEIPYNLAFSGKLLDFATRNPVFGLLLGMVAVWLLQHYAETDSRGRNLLFTLLILGMGSLWALMLKIDCGVSLLWCVALLWKFRHNTVWQMMWGTAACMLNFPAPLGLLALYAYNGKKGDWSRKLVYGWYPALLLAFGVAGLVLKLL